MNEFANSGFEWKMELKSADGLAGGGSVIGAVVCGVVGGCVVCRCVG